MKNFKVKLSPAIPPKEIEKNESGEPCLISRVTFFASVFFFWFSFDLLSSKDK